MKIKKKIAPNERIEKVYEPEVIPNRTDELIKKAEEASIRQHEQALTDRRHREDLKQKRILASKEDKFTHAINLIIERAKYQNSPSFSIDFYDFNFEDTMDNLRVLLGFLDSLVASGCLKSYSKTNYTGGTRLYFNGGNVNKLRLQRSNLSKSTPPYNDTDSPPEYLITIKDREIWVNDYLIGKPHAVGSNFEFLEHIQSHPSNTQIKRENLDEDFQEQIVNKRFIKILNALGFKGEIKKAFFYKVGENSLFYRGNKITREDLIKAGVKIPLFLKQLEVAHMSNLK